MGSIQNRSAYLVPVAARHVDPFSGRRSSEIPKTSVLRRDRAYKAKSGKAIIHLIGSLDLLTTYKRLTVVRSIRPSRSQNLFHHPTLPPLDHFLPSALWRPPE
jgi:hypothetical protein